MLQEASAPRPADLDTRALLRHVARELFANSGYDATSIREITSRADTNLGAVTYHFGTKRELYEAVLDSVFAPIRDRVVGALTEAPCDPLERIELAVRAFFAHLAANPDQPRLMFQEITSGRPPATVVGRTIELVLTTITGVVREGQEAGAIRDGNPRLLALSVLSQPFYLTLVRQAMAHFEVSGGSDTGSQAEIVDHAVEFALRGLSREPRS